MSEQLETNRNKIYDLDFEKIALTENPNVSVIFDNNRNVVSCNPIAMQLANAASVEELNKILNDMHESGNPNEKYSIDLLFQNMRKAEITGCSQFEVMLPFNNPTSYFDLTITRMAYEESYIFVLSGHNVTHLKGQDTRHEQHNTNVAMLIEIGNELMDSDNNNFSETLFKVSGLLAKFLNASRISMCRIKSDDGLRACNNLCDWYEGNSTINGPHSPCGFHLPTNWKKEILNNKILIKMSTEAEGENAEFLNDYGVQLILIVPFSIKNVVWGHMRLFFNDQNWTLSEARRNAILICAKMISNGILRSESIVSLTNSINTTQSLLDANPFSSIILNAECQILDHNLSAKNFLQIEDCEDFEERALANLINMIPAKQADGRDSVPLPERIMTAFREGYCNFSTNLIRDGESFIIDVIMKRISYKGQDAIATYMVDRTLEVETQTELHYHDKLLSALGEASRILLTTEVAGFESALQNVLSVIGRAASVDRVYVWKNYVGDDERLYTTQIYEWSPDVTRQQNSELTTNCAYEDLFPDWIGKLYKGVSVNSMVKDLNPETKKGLMLQGIMSLMLVPIFIQDKFWGFIGFDDCKNEREFTAMEENILRICGFMVMVITETVRDEMSMKLLAQKEYAEENAMIKSSFLANMSHEIRTPISAILGMTELIMHEDTTETVQSYANDIFGACRGLLTIINDILDISKIESGKLKIMPMKYNTSSLLMDVISIIKMRVEKTNIDFIVNIDANIPQELIGDELRIKQVLINLLNNAVKFTREGQISFNVSYEIVNNICMLTFDVEDTGVGIRENDIEKLFVKFQQVDTRKNRDIEGTGLGLAISKQLVSMMDGSINVKSVYGEGSTFSVSIGQPVSNIDPLAAINSSLQKNVLICENREAYINSISFAFDSLNYPYKVCSDITCIEDTLSDDDYNYIFVSSHCVDKIKDIIVTKQPKAAIVALSGDVNSYNNNKTLSISMPIHCMQIANIINGNYDGNDNRLNNANVSNFTAPNANVLVVDDNVVNLKVASGLLRKYGIQADTANCAKTAIEMICNKDYDIVFMDHMMPEVDGIDATEEIRALGGKYKNLPIIALTANAVGNVREMYISAGMNDFLAKPIESIKLNEMLQEWLPDDKQLLPTENPPTESASIEIEGLDMLKGVQSAGGRIEEYNNLLRLYVDDRATRMKSLVKHFVDEDYQSFTMKIHSLIESSATIGADNIAKMASDLESASNAKNKGYIEKNLGKFLGSISLLADNIKKYLETIQ